MADNKAAFGVFPQMKPRRSQQDREAAKNVPVDLARGFVSGALGMPGDLESLARLPYELITGNESPTILPTSEDIEKRLPFKSDTPVSRAATGAGQLAGGFYNGPLSGARAVTAVPKAVMQAGRDFVGAAGRSVSPLTVYHGSPHKFEKFDASKIGSGEGAQAYGHGLYFAEAPEVAKGYQSRLSSDRGFSYKGKSGLTRAEVQDLVNAEIGGKYLDGVTRASGVADTVIDDMVLGTQRNPGQLPRQYKEGSERAALYERLKNDIQHADPGSLYTVDLPDEKIARMLDWDKPLSEQSDFVKRTIKENELDYVPEHLTGERLLEEMHKAFEPGMVSKHLRDAGIPGIRYLDQSSRGASGTGKWLITMKNGEQKVYDFKPNDDVLEQMGATAKPTGTSNFVVFPGEEDALTILERKKAGGEVGMKKGGSVDSIRPTDVKNKGALSVANALRKAHEFASKPFGYPNPPGEMISEFLGVPAVSRTLERLGYGEPLTTGKGMTLKPKEDTIEAALAVLPLAPMTKGLPVGAVIKPKGGNFLTGSVEKALDPLKPRNDYLRRELQDNIQLGERFGDQGIVQNAKSELAKMDAIDQWIDRNLTNYVKKEMATPEDPVRKLAEQGVIHYPTEQVGANRYRAPQVRHKFGTEQLGQSEAARAWEDASDVAMSRIKIKNLADEYKEPWMDKADPNTYVYQTPQSPSGSRYSTDDLGFDHIVDILKQDLASGRIRPDQLNKVSMEQAVRRTYEFDQEAAKKMREAQIKNTEGMPVHKEYPEGYKWVELAKPAPRKDWTAPENFEVVKPTPSAETWAIRDKSSGKYITTGLESPEKAAAHLQDMHGNKALEDALKYEGDTMGHCVGGYCPDVLEGRSRIYSLRDAKGEPHVTVEVKPETDVSGFSPQQIELLKSHRILVEKPSIVQIKGKGNAAPKEQYLPFVQDFVRGGKWSEVGDFGNTGLIHRLDLPRNERDLLPAETEYLTMDEVKKLREGKPWKPIDHEPELDINIDDLGFKRGGKVSISDNCDCQMMEVMDKKMAGGGIAKLAKSLTGAKKAEGVAKSTNGPAFGAYGYTDDLLRRERGSFSSVFGVDYGQTLAPSFEFAPVKRLNTTEKVDEAKVRSLMNAMKESGNTLDNRIPPVIVDSAGNVLDGHHRVEAARRLGYEQVPIIEKFDRQSGPKFGDEYAKGGAVRMAGGGLLRKAAQALKAEKVEHPLIFPRAQPKTKEEIRPIAQRVAEQMTGDFVRQNPKVTTNPAGKSRKQWEREQSMPLETRNVVPEMDVQPIDYEKLKDYAMVGVPGDPSLGGVAKRGSLEEVAKPTVELTRVGDIAPDQPIPLFGGPRFGDKDKFWASNFGAAQPVQTNVNELSKFYDSPVVGQYIKMAPDSANFALHNLDSLLSIQRPERLDKSKRDALTQLIRKGSPKYGEFPHFAGFDDPAEVLLHSQFDSNLRKFIAETLTKPTITDKLGLPNGLDVVAAITHPELRNLETGISGFSVGRMIPGAVLRKGESSHPTYDTDIPGALIGRNKYPTPYEIAFPDTTAYARSQLKPGVQEFNMMKLLGPRERVDQQYIDEMKIFEELMKQYTGKKKGGAAKMAGGGLAKLAKALKGTQEVLPAAEREANLAKMLAESKVQQRLYHGTNTTEGRKGQEAIRRFKPSKEGALGSGTYLTPDVKLASSYSEEVGGNMLPVYAQMKNPLILRGSGVPDKYKDPMIEALEALGMESAKAGKMVENAYERKGYIGKEVESRARAAGYDGLLQYDRNGNLVEVVSYNPNAIKSAIGNRGTYDTSKPDLNEAAGGLIKVTKKRKAKA